MLIVADKVGWDAMETKAENLNHWENHQIRENQPAYEINIATEEIKTEVKYFVERLPNAANARNIC